MKKLFLLTAAILLSLVLTGCFGGTCVNCGSRMSRDDCIYDPIAGEYVCSDCYFDNAWDIIDCLIDTDFFYDNADDILDYCMDQGMIEDYLNAHGYAIVKK